MTFVSYAFIMLHELHVVWAGKVLSHYNFALDIVITDVIKMNQNCFDVP